MRDGFRIGEYFISFPPGDFVHENENGEMYMDVDIFKIEKDGSLHKANKQITPELEKAISEEINRMLISIIEKDNINK
jgi:hypothetical protein